MLKKIIFGTSSPHRSTSFETFTLLGVLVFALSSASCGGDEMTGPNTPGADPEGNPLLNGVTKAHNNIRAAVMPAPATPMPALAWDGTLAASAQAWANNCMFGGRVKTS